MLTASAVPRRHSLAVLCGKTFSWPSVFFRSSSLKSSAVMGEFTGSHVSMPVHLNMFLNMLLVALQFQTPLLPTNSATMMGSFLSVCFAPSNDSSLEFVDGLQFLFQILQRLFLANDQEVVDVQDQFNSSTRIPEDPGAPLVSRYPSSR